MDRGVGPEQEPHHPRPSGNGRPSWFGGPPRLPDYLFLMRPMILIPVWTFYILGAYHGMRTHEIPVDSSHLLLGLLSLTLLLGGIYVINQITDRESDRANRKLFLIPDAVITVRAAWIEASILMAATFLIAAALPRRFAIILLAGLALGAAYSLEPVRLKRRPFLDVAANAAGNGILNTLAGWVAIGAPLDGWRILIPYPFAVASVHLTTTLADIEGDAALGLRTTGVLIGRRAGRRAAAALMAAAMIAAAIADNRPALYASLLSLPLFLIPARSSCASPSSSRDLLPAKASTLVFSIVAGYLFPLYIPFLAAVILATRLYYRRRFDMNYPSL